MFFSPQLTKKIRQIKYETRLDVENNRGKKFKRNKQWQPTIKI